MTNMTQMSGTKKVIWYFGLEPVKARYTRQLSQDWIPNAFEKIAPEQGISFQSIVPNGADSISQSINVGSVLDATNRGVYAMQQSARFLELIENGLVQDGDALYVQDFWHPGLEAIYYALDLHGIDVDVFAMLHAQSVDEYDFTHEMRDWMRPIELGYAKRMKGIFVGSTIHKKQLREAGIETPIHVVSLPFGKQETLDLVPQQIEKKNRIMFCSRLDKEKNPYFLHALIEKFYEYNPDTDWEFIMTTSGDEFKSNMPGVVDMFMELSKREPRFKMYAALSKGEYYELMAESSIVFNSSLQDYVSWTSIEAHTFGCAFVCPNFRSFKDFCNSTDTTSTKMYFPFDVDSAFEELMNAIMTGDGCIVRDLSNISDLGRRLVARIIVDPIDYEVNIWHELELCEKIVNDI